MVIQPLPTRLIKPNFCFDFSHRRSTTVSLETRNSLGPILLFVNDLPLHLQNSLVELVDDSALSLKTHYSDLNNLTYDLNSDLDSLNEWSVQNKMFINVKKPK